MPFDKDFIVIHFGTYVNVGRDKMIPSEFCVAVFNVREGLKECYSRMVDPGRDSIFPTVTSILNRKRILGFET